MDIEQIAVVGRGMPQPMALVVPSENGLAKSDADLKKSLSQTLTKANTQLENYKKVSKIIICKDPWTVDNGLLTPTLKIKRNQIDQTFSEQYRKWATSGDEVIIN